MFVALQNRHIPLPNVILPVIVPPALGKAATAVALMLVILVCWLVFDVSRFVTLSLMLVLDVTKLAIALACVVFDVII